MTLTVGVIWNALR